MLLQTVINTLQFSVDIMKYLEVNSLNIVKAFAKRNMKMCYEKVSEINYWNIVIRLIAFITVELGDISQNVTRGCSSTMTLYIVALFMVCVAPVVIVFGG